MTTADGSGTPADALTLYLSGPDELESAATALSEVGLDLPVAPGGWTPRQIVHHLADHELHWLTPVKMALAEPGRIYAHNLPDEERWAEALDYAGRPIEPSLRLLRAVRAHVAQILRRLPLSWESYYVSFGEDAEWKPNVADMIEILNRHFQAHVEEILEMGLGSPGDTP